MTISSRSKKLADSATTRSPIKGSISRQAGQSLQEQLDEYVDDNVLLAVLPLGFMLFWLFIELVGRFFFFFLSLWLIGTLLLLSVINFVIRITIIKRKAKLMKQGLCGERYVAQIIERDLIPKGYKVFHDIEFEKGKRRFNIDHLLIGRNGIFCIETKTWSKPMRGETVAVFDGEKILINGKERQHGVIGQVRALSNEASLQNKINCFGDRYIILYVQRPNIRRAYASLASQH